VLSRQNLPVYPRGTDGFASAELASRGGYILKEASGSEPEVILIGTGSEVSLAVEAQAALEADGVPTRVVSMPSIEWFRAQDAAYRELVLPGDAGRLVTLDHFGASADQATLYREFGITAEAVQAAARESIAAARA
jgi:transketolase